MQQYRCHVLFRYSIVQVHYNVTKTKTDKGKHNGHANPDDYSIYSSSEYPFPVPDVPYSLEFRFYSLRIRGIYILNGNKRPKTL